MIDVRKSDTECMRERHRIRTARACGQRVGSQPGLPDSPGNRVHGSSLANGRSYRFVTLNTHSTLHVGGSDPNFRLVMGVTGPAGRNIERGQRVLDGEAGRGGRTRI